MGLMGTIDLSRDILSRTFSGDLTSIRFLRRWPRLSDSEALKRFSESRMAKDTTPSNFKDRELLVGDSYFSGPSSEVGKTRGGINKRSHYPQIFFQVLWVRWFGIF